MWAFYPPVLLYALWQMVRHRGILLPTAANPSFEGSGFVGESKAQILSLAMRHVPNWIAPFIAVDRPEDAHPQGVAAEARSALARMREAGLELPMVAKPDMACRGAGVKVIRNRLDLESYLQAFPRGARLLLQRLVPFEGEAGLFYCRLPGQTRGRLVSITLKYFPHVVGDGHRTLGELIADDPRAGRLSHLYLRRHQGHLDEVPPADWPVRLAFAGSHSRGAIFRNGNQFVTPELEIAVDEIARRIPEFHFGRFDVRFEDFEEVRRGRGFTILEINGAGAESTHIWDRNTGLFQAWRDLCRQYRWLFEIGAENRRRGFQPMSWKAFRQAWRREKELTAKYPPAD
jgi:hypothetical protein